MKLTFDPRAKKIIKRFLNKDIAKALEYIDLFEEYGYGLDQRYLKKVKGSIWELRPKRIRLFIYKGRKNNILVHANYKKSQKIAKKDLKILESRIKQYL